MNKDFFNYTDLELWQAFKNGQEDAFIYIYNTYAPKLYNYGWHIVKNQPLIEDCIHDLFVYLHQHRDKLGVTDSIKYYLFRALRRRISENLEKQAKHIADIDLSMNEAPIELHSLDFQFIEEQTYEQQQKSLLLAINQLPKRQREAIFLFYYSNLSYKEIASIMSLEIKTVYNQIYSALETLKNHLSKFNIFLLLTFLLMMKLWI